MIDFEREWSNDDIEPDGHGSATQIHSRIVASILAAVFVAIAAIALNPEASVNPLSTNNGRAYLALTLAIAVAAGVWRGREARSASSPALHQMAYGVLSAVAPAFFLIGRVSLAPIMAMLIVAVGLALLDNAEYAGNSQFLRRSSLSVVLLTWFGLVGLNSFDVEGRALYPAIAALTALAIAAVRPAGALPLDWRWLAIAAAIVGVELSMATSFFPLAPYGEATLWVAGAALVVSLCIATERASAP